MEKLTITEYADRVGRLVPNVSRDIKLGRKLKGVSKVEKYGRTWVLYYTENQ